MRVLLLGATGNLGSRLIPALLAHRHTVIAFVRSREKLRTLISGALLDNIVVVEGDALDSAAVEDALRTHECDAIVNAAGTRIKDGEQILGRIATSISSAAVRVGKQRGGKPLRAWFIGGMGSLEYPGTGGWHIQDYLPARMTDHHRETEAVMKAIPTTDLRWTLLCVAMMAPDSKDIKLWEEPRGHTLSVAARSPPDWQDSWVRSVPLIGIYLNLVPVIRSYTTKLEDVADLIAGSLAEDARDAQVGELIGMKEGAK
ncbi:hypothetical protein LTR36_007084 [Oleoguttula mirabilis]|uniref:NAD(P)-binding domain-containing protein n=1 Tax=Oleoguttula mirabilis TaxID=1507867 RepID=A0AAV9JB04_9PEZI|nr:hypothetical protein LTR36_007084 [Oleoguttula mirabilis]